MVELEIWRAAGTMIKRHGPFALFETIKRAVQLHEAHDPQGAQACRQVIQAVQELRRTEWRNGELLH
jgi:hypothetical protein